MKIDGKVDPREQELLERLTALEDEPENFVAGYANELEKHFDRMELWEFIEDLGRVANARPAPPGYEGSNVFLSDGIKWMVEPPSRKRSSS